jgi:hypothetical protein
VFRLADDGTTREQVARLTGIGVASAYRILAESGAPNDRVHRRQRAATRRPADPVDGCLGIGARGGPSGCSGIRGGVWEKRCHRLLQKSRGTQTGIPSGVVGEPIWCGATSI